MKRLIVSVIIVCISVTLAVAQSSEMTVEESYLQESIENMIIREQSRTDSRDMKILALSIIGDAVDRGNKGEEVHQALEYMGLEGTLNRAREGGRISNNFPDVRRESAQHLGKMGTEEAKEILLRMIYYDNEPAVVQEAIKSLGDIGIDDNGRTISTIAWVFQKFDVTIPDNLVALAAVDAVEKLGVKNGITDPTAIQMLVRIAEGPYLRAVQNRARSALINIRRGQVQD